MNQQKTGKYIADKRKLHNMTQAQLAEKLGVSDRAVSKWERGISMPDVSKYEELCEVLEVSLNELFAGEDLDEDKFREQSDQNLIGAANTEQKLRKRYNVMKAILILIVLTASIWVVDYFIQKPVGMEHIAMLTYEMPEEYGYTISKNDRITYESAETNDKFVIGKIYRNKDAKVKIIVSEWDGQWHEFEPAIEYEKSVQPWAFEEYKGSKPDFIGQVNVFHEEVGSYSKWKDSIFYKYEYYYKVYFMTDEKYDMRQYVLTVYGNDFNEVRKLGERVIASMKYVEHLEHEYIREYVD